MSRPINEIRSASKDSYKAYKVKYPKSKLTFSKWKKLLYDFNDRLIRHALETGERIKLPYGIGPLQVMKRKQTAIYEHQGIKRVGLATDWLRSKELGYKVYHLNSHTDGYRYKWYWYPNQARFFKAHIWNFRPCRKVSRLLASYIKQENSEYKHLYSLYIRKK